jgi:hypothetical protein
MDFLEWACMTLARVEFGKIKGEQIRHEDTGRTEGAEKKTL